MRKLLTATILLFLMGLFPAGIGFSETTNIAGFGSVSVEKQGNTYLLNLGKLGKLPFTKYSEGGKSGYRAEQPIAALKDTPGRDVLEKMGVKKVAMDVSVRGLTVSATISPAKGTMKTLAEFMKLEKASIDLAAGIAPKGINLRGDFNTGGIDFPIGPEKDRTIMAGRRKIKVSSIGTRFKINGLTLRLAIGKAPDPKAKKGAANASGKAGKASTVITPILYVIGRFELKPSKYDPYLILEPNYSYNLVSQQMTLGGTMRSAWENPLGIDRLLKKVAPHSKKIRIENAAVEIGWVPGSPSPTKIGIMAERVNIYGKDFGFAVDVNPTTGKGAFRARADKMNVRDFTMFFGVAGLGFRALPAKFFPTGFYLKDVDVLFSPSGGSVGTLKIGKGFRLKGFAHYGSAGDGSVDCYANMKEGLQIKAQFNGNLKDYVINKSRNVEALKPVINRITGEVNITELHIQLVANKNELSSELNATVDAFGQRGIKVKEKCSLDPEEIAKKIIVVIKRKAESFLANKLKNAKKKAERRLGSAVSSARNKFGSVRDRAHRAARAVKRSFRRTRTNIRHMMDWGKKVVGEARGETQAIVNSYINDVKGDMMELDPGRRRQALDPSWTNLCRDIQGKWMAIRNDSKKKSFLGRTEKRHSRQYDEYVDKEWASMKQWMNSRYQQQFQLSPPRW